VLKCRAWTCEICAPTRRKGVVCDIAAGHPDRLLTLTMRPDPLRTPAEQAAVMSKHMRRLLLAIRKRWPATRWSYFAVFEAHKSGQPHLHLAMRGKFINYDWLQSRWLEISGSRGVNIKFVPDAKKAAGYIGKYLGKDLHKFGTLKRYWYSKDWRIDARWVPSSDPRFFRGARIERRTPQELEHDWGRSFRQVWWEGHALIAGPRAPPDVEAMRRAFDALA